MFVYQWKTLWKSREFQRSSTLFWDSQLRLARPGQAPYASGRFDATEARKAFD